jgi:hypothetical protein
VSPTEIHTVEAAAEPAAALAALARTAEEWGAEYQPADPGDGTSGRLRLPVVAGLRRGWTGGTVTAEPTPAGTLLSFLPDEGDLYVHTPAVVILLIAAVGGLLTVLWPFAPRLLPVAPFGAVLALGGWFLVLTRLRASGPRELLDAAAAEADADAEPEGE